jgi:hypothetical protein
MTMIENRRASLNNIATYGHSLYGLYALYGSSYLLPVIEKAHALGLYVITCDYLPHDAV